SARYVRGHGLHELWHERFGGVRFPTTTLGHMCRDPLVGLVHQQCGLGGVLVEEATVAFDHLPTDQDGVDLRHPTVQHQGVDGVHDRTLTQPVATYQQHVSGFTHFQ